MTLEATMIILDNSDWARNGDFFPNRWASQHDSAHLLAETKCNLNLESSVGLMTMAGKQVEVLLTPLSDTGKVLTSLHAVRLGGRPQLSNALQISQLALKHRMNKNQKQRIVVFVASPIEEDEKTLVALGKKFKKNNIALDVINLEVGSEEQNKKLREMVAAADNSENSHYFEAQPGMQMLSDTLVTTAIYQGAEAGGMGGGAGAGAGDFGGGGQIDPELEMAIRISLEEEKQRNARKEDEQKANTNAPQPQQAADNKIEEEKPVENKPQESVPQDNKMAVEEEEDEEERELMRRAQELSLQDPSTIRADKKEPENPIFNDPSFINDLVNDLNLDQDDPELKKMLEEMKKNDKEKDNQK